MTDRYIALTVVLERDVREDDAAVTINAIRALRHVQDVVPVVTDPVAFVVEARVRRELGEKLFAVVYPQAERPGRT